MKPFSILRCDCLDEIKSETLSYIEDQHPELLNQSSLWHKSDTGAYMARRPTVANWFHSMGWKIREISFTVMTEMKDIGLHVDEGPIVAKVNIPILNTANTFNRWFKIQADAMQDVKYEKINEFGSLYKDFSQLPTSLLDPVGEYELLKPVVFNSAMPHSVHLNSDAVLPRVVMSCMTFNDISSLLV